MKEYRKIKGFERYLVSSDGEVVNSVTGCARGKCKSAYGYVWVYEGGGASSSALKGCC